jgi:hypothetical protein
LNRKSAILIVRGLGLISSDFDAEIAQGNSRGLDNDHGTFQSPNRCAVAVDHQFPIDDNGAGKLVREEVHDLPFRVGVNLLLEGLGR